MATGTVKFFNTQKGFGFITPADGSKDVFVHISAVERAGMSTLNEGQRLNYDIISERGDADFVWIPYWPRLAMSTAVKGNQTEARRRSKNPKGLVHVGHGRVCHKRSVGIMAAVGAGLNLASAFHPCGERVAILWQQRKGGRENGVGIVGGETQWIVGAV